eukprot:5466632-Alexandrium_andersonii.AAC.1
MADFGFATGRGRCMDLVAVGGASHGHARAGTPAGRGALSVARLAQGTASTCAERVAHAEKSRA